LPARAFGPGAARRRRARTAFGLASAGTAVVFAAGGAFLLGHADTTVTTDAGERLTP